MKKSKKKKTEKKNESVQDVATRWPTPEEIEAQQSPFDPNGQYPFDYKIVIVEQVGDLFEEQLRTYTIPEPLKEDNLAVPDNFKKETGRRFRLAQEGEEPELRVMNQATTSPLGLVAVKENA